MAAEKIESHRRPPASTQKFGTLSPREPSLLGRCRPATPSRPARFDDNIIGDWFNRREAQTGPAQWGAEQTQLSTRVNMA